MSDAFRALAQFPHGGRMYYILQCLAPLLDGDMFWYDWMPNSELATFDFECDAREEAARLQQLNIPRNAACWRVVAVVELRQILQKDEEA